MNIDRLIQLAIDGDKSVAGLIKVESKRRSDGFLRLCYKLLKLSTLYDGCSTNASKLVSTYSSFGKMLDKHFEVFRADNIREENFQTLLKIASFIPYYKRKSSVSSNRTDPNYFRLCRYFNINTMEFLKELTKLNNQFEVMGDSEYRVGYQISYKSTSIDPTSFLEDISPNLSHLNLTTLHLRGVGDRDFPFPSLETLVLEGESHSYYEKYHICPRSPILKNIQLDCYGISIRQFFTSPKKLEALRIGGIEHLKDLPSDIEVEHLTISEPLWYVERDSQRGFLRDSYIRLLTFFMNADNIRNLHLEMMFSNRRRVRIHISSEEKIGVTYLISKILGIAKRESQKLVRHVR